MIDPDKRSLLTDALTPPPGFCFDTGVATTYSLDLVTLLALPLHLSWLATGEERPEQVDAIRMIEALRRTADRLTVFCERGRMLAPRLPSPLLGLLEGIVHEAIAPHGGAFHPKVWVLRFTSPDEKARSRLRLLVMSRNLTDDASWDLCLQLDGTPGTIPLNENDMLAEFLGAVARQSRKPVAADRMATLATLIKDVRQCVWELPPDFDKIRFHALGLGQQPSGWLPRHPDGKWDELGVISPFVGSAALGSLSRSTRSSAFLVSRPEELDALTEPLAGGFTPVMVLDERAELGEETGDAPDTLRGLHAKVFVARSGWYTHLFIGSANATDAALVHGRNVEFMAELVGRHSKVGRPESWLGDKGLQQLLQPYERSPLLATAATQAARQALERLHRSLCNLALTIDCVAQGEDWALHLSGLPCLDMGEAQVAVWPLTLNAERAVSLAREQGDEALVIGVVARQEITSFIGFHLRIDDEELRFGLEVELRNAPAERDREILRLALGNREGFLRYLSLLLGGWMPEEGGNAASQMSGRAGRSNAQSDDMPLFEMLARAYAREPQRLAEVAELMERLKRTGDADVHGLIPPDFLRIWNSFEEAMQQDDKP